MALRFTVLASGSAGNAALVESADCGALIDMGLGPRQLAARLASAGLTWAAVHAVLLTHTHGDHWKDRTFAHLGRRRIPLYCHVEHRGCLNANSPAFGDLQSAGLVRSFAPGETLELAPGLRCLPVPVRHDGGATFGFRLEGKPDLFGQTSALAYAADLGCWDEALVEALADVDLLALEFNHDVQLERASGRMPRLIARVLGDEGHLSNAQAAALVQAVQTRSPAGRLRHLVQLHLSRDCNRPALARGAARAALADDGVSIHTAEQDAALPPLRLRPPTRVAKPSGRPRRAARAIDVLQGWLPGLGEEAG